MRSVFHYQDIGTRSPEMIWNKHIPVPWKYLLHLLNLKHAIMKSKTKT